MKKLLLSAVLLSGIALTSCSKEKDCSCETEFGTLKSTTVVTIPDGKCEDLDETSTILGATSTTTCTKQ